MNAKIIGIFAVASVGALALGCGDSTTNTGGSGGGTSVTATAGGTTSKATGTGTTTATGTTTSGTANTGATSTGTGASCTDNCQSAHAEGYMTLTAAVIKGCGCGPAATSPCATQCAGDPACATPPGAPTGACDTCIQGQADMGSSSMCVFNAALGTDCMSDPDCAALVTCELQCGA